MIGCSHRCKCVGCGNPYGSSQAAKQAYTHVTTSRYRPKQKLQEVREHLQSWLSDESRFNSSIWMVRDWKSYIRLSCELRIFEGLSIEPSRVYEYYSKLHDISKNLGSPLQPKKAKQIDGKLQSIKKVAKGFEALYKKQVELNWFWLNILFWILNTWWYSSGVKPQAAIACGLTTVGSFLQKTTNLLIFMMEPILASCKAAMASWAALLLGLLVEE